MKIKTKLIISNISMMLIPIICGVLVGALGSWFLDSTYIYSLNEYFEDENAVVSAQSTIYSYQKELWNTNWTHLEDIRESKESGLELNELDTQRIEFDQTTRMTNLGTSLENMGYHFAVFMNGEIQYSNMTKQDDAVIQDTLDEELSRASSLIIGKDDSSIIKSTFKQGDIVCEILAVNVGNRVHGETTVSHLKKYIIRTILVIVLIVLFVIFISNVFLSGWISHSILKPLSRLSQATRNIREGDLDTPLNYDKSRKNEIVQVCCDFEEMRKYLKETALEKAENEERKREMISGISHDLRTPLTTIEGYLEGIMAGIAVNEEMKKRYLQAAYTRSKDMEKLVDKLSVYNRHEYLLHTYQCEEVCLEDLLRKYADLYLLEMEKEKLQIVFQTEDEPTFVDVDKKEFQRVFDNLVTNSLKYSGCAGCVMKIIIKKLEEQVQIIFQDNGQGVQQGTENKIFDSFYRGDTARSNISQGSGLGLSIVKSIIEGHRGSISAGNIEGGFQIIILLPHHVDNHSGGIKES